MAGKMLEFTRKQDDFIGVESASEGFCVRVSYWRDLQYIEKKERVYRL